MDRLVPSRYLTGLAELVAGYGRDAADIAASIGLDARLLEDPQLLLPDRDFNALMEACALACDDRFLLLGLAQRQSLDLVVPAKELIHAGDTLGDMLDRYVVLNARFNPGFSSALIRDEGLVTLSFDVRAFGTFDPLKLDGQLHMVDHSMALFCYALQDQFGSHWRPQYALFQYSQPEQLRPLQGVFGEKLYFNQDLNALCFTEEDCNRLVLPGRLKQALPQVANLPVDTGQGVALELRVDQIIRRLLDSGRCSAQEVADILGMKLRTLQHQLRQNNTSYQAQYNLVRLDLARYYLGNSQLSIAAVAERLRFTDSAAFSNFFRQQTGTSPRDYAKRVRA